MSETTDRVPTVDPEAPTPKTKLPWLVKSATFDQLSLTLALLEEQGYTPTLISPGGMIPDSRGGGHVWSGVAYTVCGKLKDQELSTEEICERLIAMRDMPYGTTPEKRPQREPYSVEIPPEKAPSLPVQPKGKGKK